MAKWGGRSGGDDFDAPDAADGAAEPEFGSTEWLLAQLNGGRPPAEPRTPLLEPVEQAAPVEPASFEPLVPLVPAAWPPIAPQASPVSPPSAADAQGEYPPTAAFPIQPAADETPVAQPSQWAEPTLPVPPAQVAPASAFAPPPLPFDAFDPGEPYAVPRPIQPDFFEAKQREDDALPPFVLQPPAPAVPVAPVAAAPAEPAEPVVAEPFVPAAPFKPATRFVPAVAQIPTDKLPTAQTPIDRVPGVQPPLEQTFTAAILTPADELAGMFGDDDADSDVDGRSAAEDESDRSLNGGLFGAAAAGGFAASASTNAAPAAAAAEAPVFQWGLVAGDEAPAGAGIADAAIADTGVADADAAELNESQPAASVEEEIADTPVLGAFFGRKRDLDQFAAAAAEKAGSDADTEGTSDDVLADWLAASLPSADGASAQSGPPALITPPEHDEAPLEIPSVGAPFRPRAPYVPAASAASPALGAAAVSGQSAAAGSPFAGLTPTASGAVSASAPGSDAHAGSGSGGSGSGSGTGASGAGGSGKKPTKLVIAIAAVAAVAVLGGLFALGTALPKLFGGDTSSDASSSSAEPIPSATLPPAPVPEAMQPAGEHAWDTLYGGECIDPFTSQWAETFTVVDCAAPHAAQLVFRGQLGGEESTLFPGEEALSGQINALCGAPGIVDMAAAAGYGDLQLQGSFPVTEEQWNSGQHSYFCFVSQVSGEPITGSLAGPGPAV